MDGASLGKLPGQHGLHRHGLAGATTDPHVVLNGRGLFAGDIRGGLDTPTNVASYKKTISIAKGDQIDFAVGPGGNGYICDSTGLVAKITLAAPASGGTVYDAAADLTKESIAAKANPNGAWSYGCRGTAVSSELTLYPLSGVSESWRRVTENVQGWWLAPTRDAWSPPTPFVLKNVGRKPSPRRIIPFPRVPSGRGEMYVHPGPANTADRPPANVGSDYAVVRWTAPRREATRSTRPSPAWTPGAMTDVHVVVSGRELFAGDIRGGLDAPTEHRVLLEDHKRGRGRQDRLCRGAGRQRQRLRFDGTGGQDHRG